MEGVSDEDAGAKLKRMIFIMDSMDNAELDSDGLIFVSSPLRSGETRLTVSWTGVDENGRPRTPYGTQQACVPRREGIRNVRERGRRDAYPGPGDERVRKDGGWDGERQ